MLLAVTSSTWIITGLGFGIVLALLFCLVYILQFFGWTMQKATAPRAPKASQKQNAAVKQSAEPTDEGTKVAIAMALSQANETEQAAIAYALYLAKERKHDVPTGMISIRKHQTEWNDKTVGLNNKGF